MLRATTACTFSTSQLPKVRLVCFVHFDLKCASRNNGVHFFDSSTSKSALNPSVFNTFDLEMCFSPQRRAIFHLSSGQLAPHLPLYRAYFSIIGKTHCFATFLAFRAPGSSFFSLFLFLIFFLLLFSSLTLPISAFHLSILSEV